MLHGVNMSYSPLALGFFVIGGDGLPVVEKSHQGNYSLIFLNRSDAARYRQQMSELRRVSGKDCAIATMPIHQIQRLLSHAKIRVCVIHSWDAVVA